VTTVGCDGGDDDVRETLAMMSGRIRDGSWRSRGMRRSGSRSCVSILWLVRAEQVTLQLAKHVRILLNELDRNQLAQLYLSVVVRARGWGGCPADRPAAPALVAAAIARAGATARVAPAPRWAARATAVVVAAVVAAAVVPTVVAAVVPAAVVVAAVVPTVVAAVVAAAVVVAVAVATTAGHAAVVIEAVFDDLFGVPPVVVIGPED
jgi:hypothetical protein